MRLLILTMAVLLLPLIGYGQEKAEDVKPEAKIIVPQIPVPVKTDPVVTAPPTPPPEPKPADVVPKLVFGQLYVIQSDVNIVVCVSPADIAKPLYDVAPDDKPRILRMRGVFTDGLGEVETRSYTSKYVVIVEATKGANADGEILIYPEGTKSEEGVMRIKVKVGQGPRPPPVPDTPDVPDVPDTPKPDTPVTVKEFRVIWVLDPNQALTRAQVSTVDSTVIWKWLMDNCTKGTGDVPEWRKWAPNQKIAPVESAKMKDIWAKVKEKPELLTPTPKLIVVVNDDAKVYDIPATPEATLEFLKMKREGK